MSLYCDNIGVQFPAGRGSVDALDGVSISCAAGEIVSLIGPSGCGKSTLLRVMAGLQTPTSGSVSFSGEKPRISLVFQEGVLFPWLTALENAAFGLEAAGVAKREREERANEYLARLGLGGREGAYPHELSAGMRQRVALVRSFLTEPDLLLMDEPFAALDAQTRVRLQRELLELWRNGRPGIVFVTHDIDEAIALGDRVVLMQKQPGRILAEFRVPVERPRLGIEPAFLRLKAELLAGLGLAVAVA